jgi:hypothetical protein
VSSQTSNHPTKYLAKFGYRTDMKIEITITNPFLFWLPVETCCKKSGNTKTNKICQRGVGGAFFSK